MSPDPRRELRRLQDSPVFKTYTELRRMSMCYGMMDAKLSELQEAVRRVRCSGPARWSSYDAIESETMEVCQLLADFLSRMYSCKNLASVMAKRHGIDREFRSLKHDCLGFEASVVVNLRNYVVHVDMMPLEIDVRDGRILFTRRCRGDDIWSVSQKAFLRETDLESLLTTCSEEVSAFYARFFGMLTESMRSSLGECRREVGELNRRLGYEMVRFDPMAGIRA